MVELYVLPGPLAPSFGLKGCNSKWKIILAKFKTLGDAGQRTSKSPPGVDCFCIKF